MTAHSGPGWRLAGSLIQLEAEVNTEWPTRDHASDGSIGDAAHKAEGAPRYDAHGFGISGSDHDPDVNGVVCAIDIDSGPGIDPQALANAITHEPDPRISYVIWNRRIFSSRNGSQAWEWRAYGGSDPHTNHVHVSVRHGQIADDTTPWAITSSPAPAPQPTPEKKMDHVWIGYVQGSQSRYIIGAGTKHLIGSGAVYDEWKVQAQLRGLDVLERPCTKAWLDDLTTV